MGKTGDWVWARLFDCPVAFAMFLLLRTVICGAASAAAQDDVPTVEWASYLAPTASNPSPNATEPASNWRGGYFCSCHGSMYDLAGRVFRDVPAPYNLPVPPYHFISDTVIRIGENSPGIDLKKPKTGFCGS